MTSRAARIALVVVGALAVLTGGIWIGQGLNLIPGSVMTGDRTWFYIGLVVLAVGDRPGGARTSTGRSDAMSEPAPALVIADRAGQGAPGGPRV